MRLAPTLRGHLDNDKRDELDKFIDIAEPKVKVNCQQFKINRRKCGSTWAVNKENEVEIIGNDFCF